MAQYSKTILLGNLVRDVELKYTQAGVAIANFSLAVNSRYKNKNGEWVEKCSFIDCKAFGRTAEVLAEYTSKGKPVFVEGELEQESWDDKQTGQKRSKLVVKVEVVQLLGSRSDSNQGSSHQSEQADSIPDDDIPF